jgi:3-dehydroquinate synthase
VPYAVVNDFLFLRSQNPEINRQGLIEAIKVALVKDVAFFDWIEEHASALSLLQDDVLQECVKRSALLHARHITSGGDPFEMGSSRPLDFGHWAAHKLEQLTQFQLSHAAAVAIGLWLDVKYSVKCGLLLQSHAERIGRVLQRMEMPMFHEMLSVRDADGALLVIKGLEEFREHLGGRLTVLLLKEPGVGVDAYEMDASLIETCVLEMQQAAMQLR